MYGGIYEYHANTCMYTCAASWHNTSIIPTLTSCMYAYVCTYITRMNVCIYVPPHNTIQTQYLHAHQHTMQRIYVQYVQTMHTNAHARGTPHSYLYMNVFHALSIPTHYAYHHILTAHTFYTHSYIDCTHDAYQRTYALQYAYVLVLMVCGIRALVYMVCWYA